jgi:hypothetical protein
MTRTAILTALVAYTLSPLGDARGDSLMLRSGKTVACDFVKYADGRFHVLVSGKAESYECGEVQALTSQRGGNPFDDRTGALAPSREGKLSKLLSSETVPKGFEFRDSTLSAVRSWLQDRYDIPVFIDAKALREAGVEDLVDSRVFHCDLQGISVGDALLLILRPHDLAYTIRHGTVFITTASECDRLTGNSNSATPKEGGSGTPF